MQISDQILSMRDDCIKIRRDLHRIPEIGFELHKTHEYIRPILEDCRPDELITIAQTGFKVVFYAEGAERTVAFRADMDGMRNTEENRLRFRSRHRGVMHGCGHDGHMTILLLLAKWISHNRSKLRCDCTIVMSSAATTIASTPICGVEAWALLPWTLMTKSLVCAMRFSQRMPILPAGTVGQRCRP